MTHTKDEALDLALEALGIISTADNVEWIQHKAEQAITAIKQARSAPVQEPVAWMYDFLNPDNRDEVIRDWVTQDYNDIELEVGFNVRPLYTTPPAAQPAPVQDIPDLIAGALGVSRGTAYDLMREALADRYSGENPLGGPAKVFNAMADAIRAGDDYHAVLRQYGFAEATSVQEKVAVELKRIAQESPVNGNNLAQARVLMAAKRLRNTTPPAQL